MRNLVFTNIPQSHVKIMRLETGESVITLFNHIRQKPLKKGGFYFLADATTLKLPASQCFGISTTQLIDQISHNFNFYWDFGLSNE